ncbi:dihydropteroate synthase, partial [Leptolyngbya sp. FACHB-36]|nr:dihydropteroate synthase [Leptolyngbya sp. FACHB-36]
NQPDPKQRVWGTAATCCAAIAGGADILRVHDVRELRDVCRVADAIWREG